MGKGCRKTIWEKIQILLQTIIYYGLMLDIVDAVIVVWLCFQTKKTFKLKKKYRVRSCGMFNELDA